MIALLRFIGSIRLAIACLIAFMAVVFFGTLDQAQNGLYLAQQHFFYAWISWLNFNLAPLGLDVTLRLPIPGGALVMTVFTFCLAASMLVHFRLGWRKAGLWLAHIGLLLMMVGGAFTKWTGIEAYLTLNEGESSNLGVDYREWEFSLWSETNTVRDVYAVDAQIAARKPISFEELGVTLKVDTYYRDTRAMVHKTPPEGIPFSISGITELEPKVPNKDPQKQMPGAIVTLSSGEHSRRVLLFSGDEHPTPVRLGDREVTILLRRVRYPLPLLVKLDDFRKDIYANSTMAEGFSSHITVTLGDELDRDVAIEMNKPFRYLGWTFYQASYTEDGRGRESSTFAMTRNFGRLIPYFATGITFIGMALHFALSWKPRRGGKS